MSVKMPYVSRRALLTGLVGVAAAGCSTTNRVRPGSTLLGPGGSNAGSEDAKPVGNYATAYGPVTDGGFDIPGIPLDKVDKKFLRKNIRNRTGEKPGTLVVETGDHFLYHTLPNGRAMRYGVGLGRAGFEWSGRAVMQWKRKWPTWTPPEEMIERQPELEKYSADNGGMPPGLKNPLGARALYIFQDGQDTLYRLHGSPEWSSIGKSVSSGCVRLMNQDIIHLYNQVKNGSPIVVR